MVRRQFAIVFLLSPLLLLPYLQTTLPVANQVEATSATGSDIDNIGNDSVVALKTGQLVFVQLIYRHGDRTPVEPYPTDPWSNLEYWPTGWGQLTNMGKQQQFQLGQFLRKRYDSLLNREYSLDDVYIRSTDMDRTLMSAQANLAGIYPPKGGQVWNKQIDWQPIPVHTMPEGTDYVLASKVPCPQYERMKSALIDSPPFKQITERYKYLYDYLSKYSGMRVDSFEAVQRLNNTFFIESLYRKALPEWTKRVYPSEDMTFICMLTFAVNTYTRQLARLKVGPLIKEILERFRMKANGELKPNRNAWIYSAHDTTVANVLSGFKVFEMHSPPYVACVMLEMRIDENCQPFISIFYKNTSAEPQLLRIPGCGPSCPLDQMFKLYNDILPGNWEDECKLSTLLEIYKNTNYGYLLALMAFMTIPALIFFLIYRRHNSHSYFSYTQVT